ncbi:2-dehydro-3-deoxy-6-phosphogalactonate aldolase [Aquincola sp. MAHUQ-54]|uniref:2-dehydro-3-deoxy-6-phosphogalactonate aldolase n=1 Tax=Aquincola agrisoli TaxID=3119538 RepID=A0AAW9QJ85_9BURK
MTWPTALPLVAILRGITPAEAEAHARVLLAAGFDAIEVPTNSPDWAESVRRIVALAPSAWVGAGTVLDGAHLDALEASGGRLAVSPHTDVALIAESVRRGLCALPGALTPSEVFAAARAGATAVKIFPAASLGPSHVKAMRAVLPPALPLLAVGGVGPGNLADYLDAGCAGAGLGGELYRAGQAPDVTARQARAFVEAWRRHQDAAR